ncbi:MAG: hypothetical protein ACYDAZ_00325 [Thermoplasmataceae archaeon]
MLPSEHYEHPRKANFTADLPVLLLLIFVVVTIYQFLYFASEDRFLLYTGGSTFFPMIYDIYLFNTISDLALFIVLFLLIRIIPGRNIVIRGTPMLAFSFFVVAYLAGLAGLGIFSLVAVYFLPANVHFSYGPLMLYLLFPLSLSVILSFVCIGAVFSRNTVDENVKA